MQGLRESTLRSFPTAVPWAQLADGYLAGLNIRRRFVVPNPPPPPLSPASTTSSSSSSGLSSGALAGIIVGSVVGAALLVALAVVAIVAKRRTHRRWGLFGKHLAPGVGPNTTLLVTDIENSTLLWCVRRGGGAFLELRGSKWQVERLSPHAPVSQGTVAG